MYRLSWIKRPLADEQNTGREAFQRPIGLKRTPVNGAGGIQVVRNFKSYQPANIVPGPSVKPVDPSVTGNVNETLRQGPLSDPRENVITRGQL